MRKPKIGDRVITKGYSDKWDGKILTINKVQTKIYENLGIHTFCWFDEDFAGWCNFEDIDIKEWVDFSMTSKQIPTFNFAN